MPFDKLTATLRPEFAAHDPKDIFLRDVAEFGPKGLEKATHVIVGCPQDEGVHRNNGRRGAASAPAAIRAMLHKFKPPADAAAIICDLGDIDCTGTLEEIHERHHQTISALLGMGKKVIVLGGGNDISYPDVRACADTFGEIYAINADAHLDMRKASQAHSGTPYRQLVEGGHLRPANLHEVGIQRQANSPEYLNYAESMSVNIHMLADIREQGFTAFTHSLFGTLTDKPLFFGLDMDSVRAADAPGVSAPCAIGFSAEEAVRFAQLCRMHQNAPLFEITETNPEYDQDGRTARLAALVAYTYIYGWA